MKGCKFTNRKLCAMVSLLKQTISVSPANIFLKHCECFTLRLEFWVKPWHIATSLNCLLLDFKKEYLVIIVCTRLLAGSVHATSIAASRVEQALSEVASSLQSSAPKHGPLHPWLTLAQIWLHAGTYIYCYLMSQSSGPPHPPPFHMLTVRYLWIHFVTDFVFRGKCL